MNTLDLARQLAADRRRALRPGSRRDRTRARLHPHPVRRFVEWLDRVAPATSAAPC